jgi:hypothetical protein
MEVDSRQVEQIRGRGREETVGAESVEALSSRLEPRPIDLFRQRHRRHPSSPRESETLRFGSRFPADLSNGFLDFSSKNCSPHFDVV